MEWLTLIREAGQVRRSAVLLAFILIAALGVAVPSVAASTSDSGETKVVIIVGATEGATASYRADADVAYAEARRYTSDVTRVYSPNATWKKVKAATVGASIVVYMGHGNGWPSPYTFDPKYTTKDGFGLNETLGNGDSNKKYYGEPSVSTLDLAPGAIILLHHLCYASGNSESGAAEPTVSVARKRADNYAAGFLKAGAAAVIADGHAGAESYIRALFTTHQSIESMWRTMPNQNGHVTSFASTRTPGATIFQDPNKVSSGFYRSLAVGQAGITTDEVVAGGITDTSGDPTSLEVPGNASVATDGTGLYDEPGAADPARSLPADTRLRVVDAPVTMTGEAVPLVEVVGIDDPSITGFVAAGDLVARDSTAPIIRGLTTGGQFSPNGDQDLDTTAISARFSEDAAWTLEISGDDGPVFDTSGEGASLDVTWDGLVGGTPVADGAYHVRISATDDWDNGPTNLSHDVIVDTVRPIVSGLEPGPGATQWFSPNGDGTRDSVSLTATTSEPGSLVTKVRDADDAIVAKWTTDVHGSAKLSWDGRTTSGDMAPDGTYTISIVPQDPAGNTGWSASTTVQLIAALRSVATSRDMFFPQDLDGLGRWTTLSFALQRPMTVDWVVVDAVGATVATHLEDADLPAGNQTWLFDGRADDGTMLPRGDYRTLVTASDGTLVATQSIGFTMDAFGVTSSDSTPHRGQTIKISVSSPEILSGAPRLVVIEPGLARWRVTMHRTGKHHYTVTIRLRTGGGTGVMTLKVKGVDKHDGKQSTRVTYALH